jgi:hypothetical protein
MRPYATQEVFLSFRELCQPIYLHLLSQRSANHVHLWVRCCQLKLLGFVASLQWNINHIISRWRWGFNDKTHGWTHFLTNISHIFIHGCLRMRSMPNPLFYISWCFPPLWLKQMATNAPVNSTCPRVSKAKGYDLWPLYMPLNCRWHMVLYKRWFFRHKNLHHWLPRNRIRLYKISK